MSWQKLSGVRVNKKDKLLAEAQKLQQKGQYDKAVPFLQEALSLDTGDLRLRQRLAEQLVKCRRNDEARKEFEAIGRNLTSSGFYLKAIAIYKQVEKLFPDDITIALTLASLNEQHGLPANALAEYKRAFDHFLKQHNHGEALKALEAMQRVDGRNPNIKLKYAEVLHQLGKHDESLEAFKVLGLLLVERRDDGAFVRLAGRIAELFPDQPDFSCSVLEQKIHEGAAESVAALVQGLIKADPQRRSAWRLLVLAYQEIGDLGRLKTVCQHYIKRFPDELLPRQALIAAFLKERDVDAALNLLDEYEPLFMQAGAAAQLRDFYLQLNDLAPITIRILKGCARSCAACGLPEEAASYTAKIASLANLGQGEVAGQQLQAAQEPEKAAEPASVFDLPMEVDEVEPEHPVTVPYAVPTEDEGFVAAAPRELDLQDFSAVESGLEDDFYEIEVELDDQSELALPDSSQNWFDTVNDILDTVQTSGSKVRFGAGMDESDAQSHYDLGLAFYEMGLYDEAINVLRQAAEDRSRRNVCLILQGACLREKGEIKLAESALRALLDSPDMIEDDRCGLQYELALTCIALGKEEEAWRLLKDIEQINPHYRDVATRLHDASETRFAGGLDFSDDELLGFDLK
jgi:tetratricopeptide (TPR) repeat protein